MLMVLTEGEYVEFGIEAVKATLASRVIISFMINYSDNHESLSTSFGHLQFTMRFGPGNLKLL